MISNELEIQFYNHNRS